MKRSVLSRWWQDVWHRRLRRPLDVYSKQVGVGSPVVLLHGIASSGRVWQPLVRMLSRREWKVIVPDLLGFGRSPKPTWNTYSVQEHTRAIALLLRRKRIRRPIVVVAHSMGCLVAVHLAATHPQMVRRLILYEPPLFINDPQYQAHLKRRGAYFAFFEYISQRPELLLAEARTLWRVARRAMGFSLDAEEWIPFERSLRNTIMSQTAYEELGQLQIPVDIVHGRQDVVVIRTEIKEMFKHNKHITLHIVNGMHGITERAARYITQLLQKSPSNS